MTYYEYENNLYGINDNWQKGNYVQTLNISGFGPFKEVIKGFSGIMKYGAHSGPINHDKVQAIKNNNIIWSKEKIEKRLRYSERDGGSPFETFIPSFDFSYWIKTKLNITR